MLRKINRTIGICAAVVLVLSIFARGGIAGNYVNLSRSPNLEENRTIRFPIKGVVVYITPEERDRLEWIGWIQIGAGFVIGLALIIHQVDSFRSKRGANPR